MAGDDFRGTVRWPVPEQAVAVEAFADGATDPLSMRPYAEVLADMAVAPQTPTPLAVLIDGPWGSGKTTLTHMVQAEVARHPGPWPKPHIFVTFDAWANEDAADLGACPRPCGSPPDVRASEPPPDGRRSGGGFDIRARS